MVFNRKTYSINAVAVREESINQYLASDVNYHTVTRWGGLILSSLAKGVGKAAFGSGTQSTEGGSNVAVVSNPTNEISEQLKVGLGEIGDELQGKAREYYDRLPTVKVNKNETLGIMFMEEINNDELPYLGEE